MPFDREQTRKFIDLGDRDIAPFFAGRDAEIRHFESSFNTLDWQAKRTAAFRIFQGAPGCGKTSLVEHLRQRHADDALFVDIRKGHLVSEDALIERIRQTAASVGPLTGAVAAFAQAVGASLKVVKSGGDEARNFVTDHAMRNKKAVLFMDEAQLAGEAEQPGLGLLHASGLGFPTIAVFAGLSHTSDRLKGVGGLSRLPDNAIINMGAMSESECASSTSRMLDAYDASGGTSEKARAYRTVARLSRGWPKHLKAAQTALCRELLRTDGDLREVDYGRVRSESDRNRHDYYNARLSGSILGIHRPFTAMVVAAVRRHQPVDPGDLIGLCETQLAGSQGAYPGLRDTTGREYADALVERGVLSSRSDERYEVAIPSMAEWLAGLAPHRPTGGGRRT